MLCLPWRASLHRLWRSVHQHHHQLNVQPRARTGATPSLTLNDPLSSDRRPSAMASLRISDGLRPRETALRSSAWAGPSLVGIPASVPVSLPVSDVDECTMCTDVVVLGAGNRAGGASRGAGGGGGGGGGGGSTRTPPAGGGPGVRVV